MSKETNMPEDPQPCFTLDELLAFLEHKPDEPVETEFYSCREWAAHFGCSRSKTQKILRKVWEQDALETKRSSRPAIDGVMRTVSLYRINLVPEEDL